MCAYAGVCAGAWTYVCVCACAYMCVFVCACVRACVFVKGSMYIFVCVLLLPIIGPMDLDNFARTANTDTALPLLPVDLVVFSSA